MGNTASLRRAALLALLSLIGAAATASERHGRPAPSVHEAVCVGHLGDAGVPELPGVGHDRHSCIQCRSASAARWIPPRPGQESPPAEPPAWRIDASTEASPGHALAQCPAAPRAPPAIPPNA